MPKKSLSLILSLTLTLLTIALSSCSSPPPIEDLSPRIIQLVEDSEQLNQIYFGTGLPTYPRIVDPTDQPLTYHEQFGMYYLIFEDEAAGKLCMYYKEDEKKYVFLAVKKVSELTDQQLSAALWSDAELDLALFPSDYTPPVPEYVYGDEDLKDYDVVRADAPMTSVRQIKAATEAVFSKDYAEQLYSSAFDGVAFVEGSASGVRSARFTEHKMMLCQRNDIEPMLTARRVYDFDTMKIVRPSSDERVNVTVDTHLEGETDILTVTLTLVLEQDGNWYLDSPTY